MFGEERLGRSTQRRRRVENVPHRAHRSSHLSDHGCIHPARLSPYSPSRLRDQRHRKSARSTRGERCAETPHGLRTCFEAVRRRENNRPLERLDDGRSGCWPRCLAAWSSATSLRVSGSAPPAPPLEILGRLWVVVCAPQEGVVQRLDQCPQLPGGVWGECVQGLLQRVTSPAHATAGARELSLPGSPATTAPVNVRRPHAHRGRDGPGYPTTALEIADRGVRRTGQPRNVPIAQPHTAPSTGPWPERHRSSTRHGPFAKRSCAHPPTRDVGQTRTRSIRRPAGPARHDPARSSACPCVACCTTPVEGRPGADGSGRRPLAVG
jgi:hypothetical protein